MAAIPDGSAAAHRPVRKNVACTCWAARVARMLGSPTASAPASNVSAATRLPVGIRVTSFPRSEAGTLEPGDDPAVGADDGAGADGVAEVGLAEVGGAGGIDVDADVDPA